MSNTATTAPLELSPADLAAQTLATAPAKVADAPAPAPAVAPAPAAPAERLPMPRPGDPEGETDSAGVVWDRAKHATKKHPHTGRWMPRGGRRPKFAAVPRAAPAAAPEPSPWSEAERAAAAGQPAEPLPSPTAPAPGAADEPAPVPTGPGPKADADDAAEVATQAIYLATGVATGHPDEARLRPGDHANLRNTLAAYFRAKGWAVTGGLAVGLALAAYFLKVGNAPKTGDTLRARFTAWRESQRAATARRVSPDAPPAVPPRPPTAAPVRMDVPPQKTASDPFAHLRA